MRKIILKLMDGSDAGSLIEGEDGKLSGEGRGANLVKLAPSKTFDQWAEHLPHSKYLQFEVEG